MAQRGLTEMRSHRRFKKVLRLGLVTARIATGESCEVLLADHPLKYMPYRPARLSLTITRRMGTSEGIVLRKPRLRLHAFGAKRAVVLAGGHWRAR
eukprot:scaffold3027_cov31-Tisochrysis_lutea.AAC.4